MQVFLPYPNQATTDISIRNRQMELKLVIVIMPCNEYSIQLHKSNINGPVWYTKCHEQELEITINEVLKLSNNLRIVPR